VLTRRCLPMLRPDVRYVRHAGVIAFNVTEYVLGGLKPATQYVVRLAAVNQAGRGPFTPASPPVYTLPAGNTQAADALLCGRPSRPHYGSCPSVRLSARLSVSPVRAANSKTKIPKNTKNGVKVFFPGLQ